MPSLAETQALIRSGLVDREAAALRPLLLGGRDPLKRFAVHQRHYEASLVKALLGRFPACEWLVGTPFLAEAARAFVHAHPPTAPCIAEYGEAFPAYAAERAPGRAMPWLAETGALEWALSQVALAISHPALPIASLSTLDPMSLPDARLRLQPGLAFIEAAWPVDELLKLFLGGSAPDRYELAPDPIFLEVKGARGVFRMSRLGRGEFAFRRAIARGRSLADAAESAAADPSFDAAQALAALFAAELVTAVVTAEP